MYKDVVKRLVDFFFASIGFIILLPLFLLITLLLLFANKGRPFFFQERPGKNATVFKVVKFRTMNGKRTEKGELLSDADRLTKVGSIIRKTSLDEIPQLLNVIKGDMSLVGPRPLLVEYLPLYTLEQKRRHEVKPGITGWAQVNGRNAINWETKFAYDVWYVDHISLVLDCKILMMTFLKVFKREGINADGEATITKFKGSKE